MDHTHRLLEWRSFPYPVLLSPQELRLPHIEMKLRNIMTKYDSDHYGSISSEEFKHFMTVRIAAYLPCLSPSGWTTYRIVPFPFLKLSLSTVTRRLNQRGNGRHQQRLKNLLFLPVLRTALDSGAV